MRVSQKSVSRTDKRAKPPMDARSWQRVYEWIGLILVVLGVWMAIGLFFAANGEMGRWVSAHLRHFAGLCAWIVPLLTTAIGVRLVAGKFWLSTPRIVIGSLTLFLAVIGFCHLRVPAGRWFDPQLTVTAGGWLGGAVCWTIEPWMGRAGLVLVLVALAFGSLMTLLDRSVAEFLDWGSGVGRRIGDSGRAFVQSQRDQRAQRPSKSRRSSAHGGYTPSFASDENAEVFPAGGEAHDVIGPETDQTGADASAEPETLPKRRVSGKRKPAAPPQESTGQMVMDIDPDPNGYKLPPSSLLAEAEPPKRTTEAEMRKKIELIENKLSTFGVGATVVEVAQGPTITRYELQLEQGVRVARVAALEDDLALALAARRVRIEAPIPGKSLVGIELPSDNPRTVSLREVVEDDDFRNSRSLLMFALGRDISNKVHVADLARMPHLLIAGATASGKSIGLNALICSILMRATPEQVKFVMIDPKQVELSLYEGIPHLICPVVKDVKQADGILKAAVREMERRYEMLARAHTRNIEGYNAQHEEKMPYMVIVIDELADLMIQRKQQVEGSIQRLTQMARATGVHLVVATQRPSVDVVTGVIKSNLPCRIAFFTPSQVDSRTILDTAGAERLIGRGDMLYKPADTSIPTRIQGCFVSEREVQQLTSYLRDQALPDYTLTPIETGDPAIDGGESNGGEDELYNDALRLVVKSGSASASMLQRRFRIGYNRASRLIETMEDRGIVGGSDGQKSREILITKDELDRMLSGTGDDA